MGSIICSFGCSFGRSFGRALFFLVPALVGTAAFAQWSEDPASPLVLADRIEDQDQPKVVATADGGAYVSWFDDVTGGHDVYLQRLDVAGVEQWAHNGVLVGDRSLTTMEDYGLAVDTAGNALLAFRDDSVSGVQIAAAKVAPDGTVLWHVQLTATTTTFSVGAPKVAGTSDGNVVVAWNQEKHMRVQKLDPDGASLWGEGVLLLPTGGSFLVSDLQASDAGTAILAFIHPVGFGLRQLWAQKLAAADGASLWPAAHVKVFDGFLGITPPAFLSDGAGGAVFAWSNINSSSSGFEVRAQRILASGTEAFAHNGVAVSTDDSHERLSPSAAWLPASEEIVVAWADRDTQQSQYGVSAQKLASDGSRLWGASGQTLVPFGNEITQVSALPSGDGALVAWVETVASGNQPIHAARLDDAGAFVWTPGIVDVATLATGTTQLAAALSTAGFAVYTWADGSSVLFDVLAQSLGQDGAVGRGTIFGDGFESGDLSAWSTTVP